jgi:hypothetical protein
VKVKEIQLHYCRVKKAPREATSASNIGVTEQVSVAVEIYTCNWEVLGSNLVLNTGNPDSVSFRGHPRSLQVNALIIMWHVDPLLGNDSERINCTTVVTK